MNDYFYETGSTQPPKSRLLVVFLLVLLIFAGGIITALGILNIKLWSHFSPQEEESVSLRFTRDTASGIAQYASAETAPNAKLGFSVETVSGFLRTYYQLPQGVYIPQVLDGSNAAIAGVLPGDLLLAFNGKEIPDTETLDALLRSCHAGDTVTLTLYRDEQTLSVDLILH